MGFQNDYHAYLSKYEEGDVEGVFPAELSVLWVIDNCTPDGSFYLWDSLDEMHSCLVKVEKPQQRWRITQGFEMDKFMGRIAEELGVKDGVEFALKWWNLCYFKDKDGKVHYDTYYDSLYVADDNEKTLLEFRERLDECFLESFSAIDDLSSTPIYVCDDLMKYNPLVYKLQQNGFEVKPMPTQDCTNEEMLTQLGQLRHKYVVPYCGGEELCLHLFASDKLDVLPVEFGHTYLMSLMCGQMQVEDKISGNLTFKDILPNGASYCDYKSCGVEYMYLEAAFYADLFGNTLLKTANSKGESRPVLVNKFEFNC